MKKRIEIRVHPNSSKSELVFESETKARAYVHAPPEKGKANKEVVKLLSKHFKVPKSRIECVSGAQSRNKVFEWDL